MDKEKMYLRELHGTNELRLLFEMMDTDFPAFARIPIFMLRTAIKKRVSKAFFLTDGKNDYGYTICQKTPSLNMLHILYIAVLPQFRDAGLGSVFLEHLKNYSPNGIILDVENPATARASNEQHIREKRIAFYEKNGFSIFNYFRFKNFGYSMLVMSNIILAHDIDWLSFYRKLYNQAYGLPLSYFLIKPVKAV